MAWRRNYNSRRHKYNICYICAFSAGLLLMVNIVILHENCNGLEQENMIYPGGTGKDSHLLKIRENTEWEQSNDGIKKWRSQPSEMYGIFESRWRKLMELSAEDGLSVIKIENTAPLEVSYADDLIECDEILNITDKKYIASGWTKAVYSGLYKGKSIAIKTIDLEGQDVTTCQSKGFTLADCYYKAANKIVKEIVVLQALSHDNVIKVLGFCVPSIHNKNDGIAMVTELGEPVDLIKLLQMSWEDRLRVSYDLTKIIHFISGALYGSMAMNDFRRQQFVLVNGVLKLSDVDDVGFDDPTCESDEQCTVVFSSTNFTQKLHCRKGKCKSFNEKRNLFNGGRHFTTFLLPHGAPTTLKHLVSRVVDGYSNLTLNSKQLLKLMDKIVYQYRSGKYLNRTSPKDNIRTYKEFLNQDLPGLYDYRCRVSLSGAGCTLSVFDQREAEEICNEDPDCQGFVMSNQKTWSGRTLVHLKSGFSATAFNKNTTLYVKPFRRGG